MIQPITFWQQPNALRYERLVHENVSHVGKVNGFKAIEDFFYTYAVGYTTLSHKNIDVLLSVQDDALVIIEWAKCKNRDGTINNEKKQVYTLSEYQLVKELAIHLDNKYNPNK